MEKIPALTPSLVHVAMSLAAIISFAALQACSGSSNDVVALPDTPAPATVVIPVPDAPASLNVTSSTQTLHFSWPSVAGATYYKLYENADGASGYSQLGGDLTDTQFDQAIAVHLFDWPNARFMVEACNATGCSQSTDVSVMDAMARTIGYFKTTETPASLENFFGFSLALAADGNTLAVGVPFDDSSAIGIDGDLTGTPINNSGAVYVFRRNAGAWEKEAYIKASNAEAYDLFGIDIALSTDGNSLAVGANGESSNATGVNGAQDNNAASYSGAVYVFKRTDHNWMQQVYLKASNTEASDGFGISLALSGDGNTLAVNAMNEDSNASGINGDQSNNAKLSAGAVYVFIQSAGNWSQQAYIKASNPDSNDLFGNSMSLSDDGNTLAVSAYWEDSNASGINADQVNNLAHESGAVYVFTRAANNWSQQAYIKASNARANAYFGTSLSLSAAGDTLAISSFEESSYATGVDGDQNDTSAPGSGAVYVFERNASVWSQQSYLKASNTESNDRFGYNICLSASGNTLAVGATGEDSAGTGLFANQADNSASGAGAAYVFGRSASSWQQVSYVKATNTNAGDEFGRTVALSADGSLLAVGAVGEDSQTTGINPDSADNSLSDAGAVYVY